MKRTSAATLAGIFLSSTLSGCALPLFERTAAPSYEPGCFALDTLNTMMKNRYAEEPAIIAQDGPRSAFIFFATPPGAKLENGKDADTWTMITVPDIKKNKACTLIDGEHFHLVTNRKLPLMPGLREASLDGPPMLPKSYSPIGLCKPHSEVMKIFEKRAGLVRLAYAQNGKLVMEIFGVPSGTLDVTGKPMASNYSIINTSQDGISCLLTGGENINVNASMLARYPKDPKPGF